MNKQILLANTNAGLIRGQINDNFTELYDAVTSSNENVDSTYTTVNSNSANWNSVYTTYKNTSSTFSSQLLSFNQTTKNLTISNGNTVSLSALVDINSFDTGVRGLTGNYSSVYTTVKSNSANWNYQGTDIKALTGNYDSVYTTVNSNSANWNYQGTDIKALTGNYDSVYTTVNSNSANWDNSISDEYTRSNFLPLSGGTVTGITKFNNNLTVYGDLSATGTSYFANTVYSTTSALSVVNIGNTGPALYIGNNGTGDIASFYDLDTNVEVLHVGGNNGSYPNVGIKTSTPNVDFTVNGQISSNDIISSLGGNSTNWNSSYTSVNSNSHNWNAVYTSVKDTSGNWDSVYTSVKDTSANWDSVYTEFKNASADWGSVSTTVKDTSANWDSVYTSVKDTSANWDSVYTSVKDTSANWDSVYTSVKDTSGNWNAVYTSVKDTSGNWDSVYTSVKDTSANWNAVYTEFKNASSTFLTTELDSQTLNFDPITNDLSILNGNTVSLESLVNLTATDSEVRELSANWENTYTTVNSNSANWETKIKGSDSGIFVTGNITLSGTGDTVISQDGNIIIISSIPGSGTGGVGTVTNVSGNLPIQVSNGNLTPTVSINNVTTSTDGAMSYIDKQKLDTLTDKLSTTWQNTYTTVNTTSANYDSVYTTVNSNSATWNYQGTDVKQLTGNYDSVYTTVNSNSATWNSTYTTFNNNSASYVTETSLKNNFLPLSGGTITQDLNILGKLTINGLTTQITATNLSITDALVFVANNNTTNVKDVGLVGQYNDGFQQYTGLTRIAATNTWTLFSGVTSNPISYSNIPYTDSTFKIETLRANLLGDVTGNVSGNATTVTNGIYTNNVYTKPSWIGSIDTSILDGTEKTNWNSSYTTVKSNSATWNYQGTDVKQLTGNYDSVYTTVKSNSANWNYQGTDVKQLTGNYDSVYTTVKSNSANWNYQGTDIKALTGNYDSVYTTVKSNSATWRLEDFIVACSDESTSLTTNTSALTFRVPFGMYLNSVRASVNVASVGSPIIVDVKQTGSSIFTTKLSIDASEETSTTAATPAVISNPTLIDDAKVIVSIDQVGSTTPGRGLKLTFKGYRV
jgi:hypothetical protein